MNWDTLLRIFLAFIIYTIEDSGGSPDAVSTGSNEAPWMWMSANNDLSDNNSGTEVLEVVEVLDEPHVVAAPIDLNTEPRFVGHLRRKLCKVGLGVGQQEILNCDHSKKFSALNRSKRSASPQFLRINDRDDAPIDLDAINQEDQIRDQKDDQGMEEPSSGRLFGSGLDGLGLNQRFSKFLNPHISPSVGVHFGAIPYGYGGHYGGHYGSPFQFNLGPLSINPFGGLRFSLHNGRPHIRPTLDLLITPNKRDIFNFNRPHNGYHNGHHNGYHNGYQNGYQNNYHDFLQRNSRDADKQRSKTSIFRNPLAKLFKASLPLKLAKPFNPGSSQPTHNLHVYNNNEYNHQDYHTFQGREPTDQNFFNHKVVFTEDSGHQNTELTSPILFGRSQSFRDDREDIYSKTT